MLGVIKETTASVARWYSQKYSSLKKEAVDLVKDSLECTMVSVAAVYDRAFTNVAGVSFARFFEDAILDSSREVVDEEQDIYRICVTIEESRLRRMHEFEDEFYIKLYDEAERTTPLMKQTLELAEKTFKRKPGAPEEASRALNWIVYASGLATFLFLVGKSAALAGLSLISQVAGIISLVALITPTIRFSYMAFNLILTNHWLQGAKHRLAELCAEKDKLLSGLENRSRKKGY